MSRDEPHPVVAGLRLKWHDVPRPATLAGDGPAFGLWVLDQPDALLDAITQEEFDRNDQRMPYFGTLWPSAESLVAKLLTGPRLDGRRVLDLGCGLGLCGLAAAALGARVTFMDWEPRALEIVAASVRDQAPPLPAANAPELIAADWRRPPPLAPFDLILGADVLYEERNAPAVADFLAAHLAHGAEAWISDPNRPHSRRFPKLAQDRGLEFLASEILPPPPGGHHQDVTLLRLRSPARRGE